MLTLEKSPSRTANVTTRYTGGDILGEYMSSSRTPYEFNISSPGVDLVFQCKIAGLDVGKDAWFRVYADKYGFYTAVKWDVDDGIVDACQIEYNYVLHLIALLVFKNGSSIDNVQSRSMRAAVATMASLHQGIADYMPED